MTAKIIFPNVAPPDADFENSFTGHWLLWVFKKTTPPVTFEGPWISFPFNRNHAASQQ